jgi:hypothetical protein
MHTLRLHSYKIKLRRNITRLHWKHSTGGEKVQFGYFRLDPVFIADMPFMNGYLRSERLRQLFTVRSAIERPLFATLAEGRPRPRAEPSCFARKPN